MKQNSLSAKLKEIGKSQGWLGRALGVKSNYINRICRQKIKDPRMSTGLAICRALKCKVEDIWKF